MDCFVMVEDIKNEEDEIEINFPSWMEVGKEEEEDPLAATVPKIEDIDGTDVLHDLVPTLTHVLLPKLELPTQNFHLTEVIQNLVPLLKPEPASVSTISTEELKREVKKEDSYCTEKEVDNETLACGACTLNFASLSDLQQGNNLEGSSNNNYVENTNEKWYRCDVCEYKTKFTVELKKHVRENICLTDDSHTHKRILSYNKATQMNQRQWYCRLCYFKFSLHFLVTHMLSTHVTETPPRCKFCGFKSDISSDIWQHMLKIHTVNNFCIICKVQYQRENDLVNHMVCHIEKSTYTCNECHHRCYEKNNLVTHMMKYTAEMTEPLQYKCNGCNFKTNRRDKYVSHTWTHTGQRPFKCEHCDFGTTTKSSLQSHVLTHSNEKPYACKWCEYKGKSKAKLDIHMRRHTGELPFACNMCKKKFRSSNLLCRHKAIHDKNKVHLCEICGIFKSIKSFGDHFRNHVQQPYCCDTCDYKSIHKYLLVKHLETHSNENSYSCYFCDYKSADKSNLGHHMKSHTNFKPFSCEFCEYKSARRGNLKKHLSTHNGEKPYSCRVCNYKCANQSNLITHLKMHKRKDEY